MAIDIRRPISIASRLLFLVVGVMARLAAGTNLRNQTMPSVEPFAFRSTELFVMFALLALSGCDRVEGQFKDAARGAVERTTSFARENLVSDMQKDAEAKCIAALTSAPIPREPLESWTNAGQVIHLAPVKFELATSYPLEIRVLGDGKYQIQVSLFEEGGRQGLHSGRCTVVAGTVTEHGVP